MKDNITYVGLDVHKNSIDVALADSEKTGEVRHYGTIGGDLGSLEKLIRKLVFRGRELRFVYEAGPCGYEIYRHLSHQGLDCIVAAPSLIPKKTGSRIKNDRRDSEMLARLHRAGELTSVYAQVAAIPNTGRRVVALDDLIREKLHILLGRIAIDLQLLKVRACLLHRYAPLFSAVPIQRQILHPPSIFCWCQLFIRADDYDSKKNDTCQAR